jgi:histone H3/H4
MANKSKQQEMLVVGSKVKSVLRDKNVNVGGDVLEALNGMLHWYLEQAAKRAEANGRKTVRGHDIILP